MTIFLNLAVISSITFHLRCPPYPSALSLDPDSTGNLRLWSGMVTHISVDDLAAATDYSVNEYAVSPVGRSDSGILTITTFDAQAPSTENTKT